MIFMSWISCGLPHILPHHVYVLWHDYIYILMKLSHILRHGFRIFRSELPTAKSSGLALFRSTQRYEMGLAGHAELRDTVVENHWEIAIPYEWVKMVVEWMEKSYWSTSYTDDFPYCNLWFAIFQVELQFRLRIGWYGSQVELVITRWPVELDSHWLKFRSPLMTILDMAIFSNSKHSQVTSGATTIKSGHWPSGNTESVRIQKLCSWRAPTIRVGKHIPGNWKSYFVRVDGHHNHCSMQISTVILEQPLAVEHGNRKFQSSTIN